MMPSFLTGVVFVGLGLMLVGNQLDSQGEDFAKANPLESIMNAPNPVDPREFARTKTDTDKSFISTLFEKTPPLDHKETPFSPVVKIYDHTPAPGPKTGQHDMKEIDKYGDQLVTELLYSALERDRIDVFVQPVVKIPQRQIQAYEFYGRIRARPGVYIPASRYRELAVKEGLLSKVDNRVLMKCLETLKIQVKKNIKKRELKSYFLNISGGTLTDTRFMHTLLQFLGRHKNLAKLIVLEISEHDLKALPPKTKAILDGLKQLGCQISLSELTGDRLDIQWMKSRAINYVRLSAPDLADMIRTSPENVESLSGAISKLEREGIQVIADYIEDNDTLTELLELPVRLGQGYLFGKPDSPGVYNIRLAA